MMLIITNWIFATLPNEIWTFILKFLSAKDILNLRFLSKRFYNSHNLFEVDDYYNTFFYVINHFLNNFKKRSSRSNISIFEIFA